MLPIATALTCGTLLVKRISHGNLYQRETRNERCDAAPLVPLIQLANPGGVALRLRHG